MEERQRSVEQMYRTYFATIHAKCTRMLGDTHEAEDVAQETFVRLWRDSAALDDDPYRVSGWIYRTATRLAIDQLRGRRYRRVVLGAPPSRETAVHLGACERCGGYVDLARAQRAALGAAAAALPPWLAKVGAELPSDVRAGTPVRAPRSVSWRLPPRWALATGVGVALAMGAWLWSGVQTERRGASEPLPYVAAKGAPGVAVYVMRGERVFLWNGVDAVREGDRIRLAVAASVYRHVVVCTRRDHGLVTLYRGEISGTSDLPVAWTIDGEGDAERLLVLLSHQPRSDSELREQDRQRAISRDDWAYELVLLKQ